MACVLDNPEQPRESLMQLFSLAKEEKKPVYALAPMVRYSKLPFRQLVRSYGVTVAYTPMILADVFRNSSEGRDNEFRTTLEDIPVVVQFAASNPKDLADAAEMVAKYANGVDLNCGCPQKWAIHEHIGAYLMDCPELVRDMVRQVKGRVNIPCSVKVRILPDQKKTLDYIRMVESSGVDFITVHGRTKKQKSTEPCDWDTIKLIKETVSVPVLGNGSIFSRADADKYIAETGIDGVMAGRGLLMNPALFAGYDYTPKECVEQFLYNSLAYGTNTFIFHHHLMYMLDMVMGKTEKRAFNVLTSIPGILDYLEKHYDIIPKNHFI